MLGAYRAALEAEPVLVVPTFADVDHYRRELAAAGAVFGVRVVAFSGLMREIARRAGVGGRPLSRLARERVAGAAIARVRLEALAASATTPGFVQALLRLVTELEEQRVEPGRWWAAMRAWGEREPARAAYAEELARAVRRLPRRPAGHRSPRSRPARPGRARRAAPGAGALGRDAGLPLRLRRPAGAAARRDRDARGPRGRAGHRVADLRAGARRLRRARRDLPGAHGARPRARRAAGAAPSTTSARRCMRSSARCSSRRRPGAPTPAMRCCCSRAAASAPRSSSWRPTWRG